MEMDVHVHVHVIKQVVTRLQNIPNMSLYIVPQSFRIVNVCKHRWMYRTYTIIMIIFLLLIF